MGNGVLKFFHLLKNCGKNRVEHLMREIGPVDIIIDDGSHIISDQQISLGALFPYLKSGGCYVMEDLHTSLQPPNFEVLPDLSNSTYRILQ